MPRTEGRRLRRWVQLVNALIVIKKIVTQGWYRYRWEGRPEKWKRAWGRSTAQKIKRSTAASEAARQLASTT